MHAYYSTNTWREIYASEVMPIPDPSVCSIPELIQSRVVGTPSNPKQAGRPKKKRMVPGDAAKKISSNEVNEDVGEDSSIIAESITTPKKCSRCDKSGHNVTTCTTFLGMADLGVGVIDGVHCIGEKRKRKPKSCGICGVVGHTRKKCQDPHRFE